MELIKILTKIVYFTSWVICTLPNESKVKGYSYDEPTMKQQIEQIIENDELIEDMEQGCFYEKEKFEPWDPEIWEDYQGNMRTDEFGDEIVSDEYINPDDYDSGDYGDY